MKHAVSILAVALVMLAWSRPVGAEMYYYKDANGVMVFSDTPPDASAAAGSVETIPEVPASSSALPPQAPPRTRKAPAVAAQPPQTAPQGPSGEEIVSYLNKKAQLDKKKKRLEEEGAALKAEAEALVAQGARIKRDSALRVHNRKIQEANEKIQELNRRIERLNEEIKTFLAANEKVQQAAAAQGSAP